MAVAAGEADVAMLGDDAAEVVMSGAGGVVDLDDEDVLLTVPSRKGAGSLAGVIGAVAAVDIDSGSSGSSSSSSSRSRSRSQRGRANKSLGAAAATALFTATAPLDVDECEKVIEQELSFPTAFAMQLQLEGRTVAIMSETGTVIGMSPQDSSHSSVRISGTATAVRQAACELEELRAAHAQEELEADLIEQLEIPSEHLIAIVGANDVAITELRENCGGIMIAMQPPSTPGAPLTAFIGPGQRKHVLNAKEQLRCRLKALQDSGGVALGTGVVAASTAGAAASSRDADALPAAITGSQESLPEPMMTPSSETFLQCVAATSDATMQPEEEEVRGKAATSQASGLPVPVSLPSSHVPA